MIYCDYWMLESRWARR